MSVSGELLCSFELLKPLDSSALKSHIKKSRNKRQSMLNSPVRTSSDGLLSASPPSEPSVCYIVPLLTLPSASPLCSSKLLTVCSL
jgi:hypothetical protein